MQRNEIRLKSRYAHSDNRLVHVKANIWRLKTDYNYRLIMYHDRSKIQAIDPEGGPMISVGTEIEGHIVKSISATGIIEFEDEPDISSHREETAV